MMQFDRRTALLSLLSAGAAGCAPATLDGRAAASPPRCQDGLHHYVLESGQRTNGPFSIAIASHALQDGHEAALSRLAESVGYRRGLLSYRTSDRHKLSAARLAIDYLMRQLDVRYAIMFSGQPARLAEKQSWRDLVARQYRALLRTAPHMPGPGQVHMKVGTHDGAIEAVRRLLIEPCSQLVHYDHAGANRFSQASSVIVGAITSALAGREVHGTKQAVREIVAHACGVDRLSAAALNRTGKFHIHIV